MWLSPNHSLGLKTIIPVFNISLYKLSNRLKGDGQVEYRSFYLLDHGDGLNNCNIPFELLGFDGLNQMESIDIYLFTFLFDVLAPARFVPRFFLNN